MRGALLLPDASVLIAGALDSSFSGFRATGGLRRALIRTVRPV